MKIKQYWLLILTLILILSCGEGVVEINDSKYQPKIVIQGTLAPGQIAQVKFRRNFPLNASINEDEIILRDAQATISDENGNDYMLRFNSNNDFYENLDLIIEHGKTYSLAVSAEIDGKSLSATSTTTVPNPGFRIIAEESKLGSRPYRARDENGDLINFEIMFERSPGIDFYVASFTALDADTTTFIYDNSFGDIDTSDVIDDFDDFKFTYTWAQNTPLTAGKSSIEIFSFLTWFYSDYRAIVYAADNNYRDFIISYEQIQEIDGNFHEPVLHIKGDGIGIFGSAITDTTSFTVLRR